MRRLKLSSTWIGIILGGVIGLLVALLSALDVIDIPTVGSLAADGAWAASLVGLGIGMIAGALIGSLAGGSDGVSDDGQPMTNDRR